MFMCPILSFLTGDLREDVVERASLDSGDLELERGRLTRTVG